MSDLSDSDNSRLASHYYDRIAKVIHYVQQEAPRQPALDEMAAHIGMSSYHFQRLFSQWVGISPKRFMQFISKERAKQALKESNSILEATQSSGISSVGRMHDLLVSCEAMSPGEIKKMAVGLTIVYGYADSPFGHLLLAWTERGICFLMFGADHTVLKDELVSAWPEAELKLDANEAKTRSAEIFEHVGKPKHLHLLLRGTNFQIKVWEALLNVKEGDLVSYSQLARLCHSPKAARAVGSAVAKNKIGFLIPCHRVIKESGEFGQYRWGVERKTAMIAWETARQQVSSKAE
ncbi:MAG: 6-O-methylguanine DNA methyltransferase [Neptuniibacter caesariensis]|uniref:methylated-DNA--[protein]-cysteine S-methyltransferase n=1 Tax=Neptuniibacter caesariensis TaxID=207954 RepID=A0A2G6JPG6_NEPCE|nr:MAG: 6-O-methylguanine DNA methyltransferase [Neptuniibacter caesariensis]